MESEQKSYFTEYARESGTIFPIDLSVADFSKRIGISDDTMVRRLEKDTLITIPLQSLRYSDKRKRAVNLSSGIPCIPVETQLFLECLYNQAKNKKGKIDFGPFTDTLAEAKLGIFMTELFQELCKKVMENPSNEQTDRIFTRHILFQNEKFRKAVFDKMWENILRSRLATLLHIIQKAPSTVQIDNALVNCLASLDNTILNLQSVLNSSPSQKAVEWKSALKNLVCELVSERENLATPHDRIAIYRIHNSKISENLTMREAFQQLKNSSASQRENLRKQATDCYLKKLSEKVTSKKEIDDRVRLALDFEQFYVDMKAYLDITTSPRNEEDAKHTILTYCKQYCVQTIQSCTFTPGEIKRQDSGTYKSDFLANLVYWHMDQALSKIQETVQMAAYYNAASYTSNSVWFFQTLLLHKIDEELYQYSEKVNKIVDIVSHNSSTNPLKTELSRRIYAGKIPVSNSNQNIYYLFACDCSRHFQKMWTILYENTDPIINKDTYLFNDPQIVTQRIWEGIQGAIEFFGDVASEKKITAPFASRKSVRKALRRYRRIIEHPRIIYHPSFFLEAVPAILQSLFIMALQKIAIDEANRMVEYIKPLPDLLKVQNQPL